MSTIGKIAVDLDALRSAVQEEYEAVACEPQRGFHFHTGRPLAALLGYELRSILERTVGLER